MDLAHIALTRRTCKDYDPARKIPAEDLEKIRTLLRYAPSSVNSQPWHFFIASDSAAKARLGKSTPEGTPFAANAPKIANASHVLVMCARTEIDDAHLAEVLEQEDRDGRFPAAENKELQKKGRGFYVDLHRDTLRDTSIWTQKQVYIALGVVLFGAASLGIDATPIEGYDAKLLDEELNLAEKGLKSVVLVALGYRSDADFNAKLPKSRLPLDTVISEL